ARERNPDPARVGRAHRHIGEGGIPDRQRAGDILPIGATVGGAEYAAAGQECRPRRTRRTLPGGAKEFALGQVNGFLISRRDRDRNTKNPRAAPAASQVLPRKAAAAAEPKI